MKRNLTGVQACVESIFLRTILDLQNYKKSSSFVCGYRGSPVAYLDKEIKSKGDLLKKHRVFFVDGINEELALAAVAGSQQYRILGNPNSLGEDGVTGYWYAKGPGVDRAMDALHHYNWQGTTTDGGVVLFCGNDTIRSSSTMPHDVTETLCSIQIPVLCPSNVEEVLEFSVKGAYLSRYSGLFVAINLVTEIADAYETVDFDNVIEKCKDLSYPEDDNGGIRWPDNGIEQEKRIFRIRIPRALDFIRKYSLNKIIQQGNGKIGIITVGKSHEDFLSAVNWKISSEWSVLKIGCSWPLDRNIIVEFLQGKEKVLIIEEKYGFVEKQIKSIAFDENISTEIHGKDVVTPLLSTTPSIVKEALAKLGFMNFPENDNKEYFKKFSLEKRIPYFCGGCPHNTGTLLPKGEIGVLGIGCHYLASLMPDRPTLTECPMGAEGTPWIGASPFTTRKKIFVNMGDGTYFHSGILSIRFAVATGSNVVFRILYNQAVAMTGGQKIDGNLDLLNLVKQIEAEGVNYIYVVSDYYKNPYKRNADRDWEEISKYADIFPKDDYMKVLYMARSTNEPAVVIYDQECATQKLRNIKRGISSEEDYRVDINPDICDACGDCQKKSNCMSVEVDIYNPVLPVRRINYDTCVLDLSCVKGYCPSFIVYKAENKKTEDLSKIFNFDTYLPPVKVPDFDNFTIAIFGVGGTGTSTLTKIISDLYLKEGFYVSALDKTGLAQRYGEIIGIVSISKNERKKHVDKINVAFVLDPIVFLSNLDKIDNDTVLIINEIPYNHPHVIQQGNIELIKSVREKLKELPNEKYIVDFFKLLNLFMGTRKHLNVCMLGFAFQKNVLKISPLVIEEYIRSLNKENRNALFVGFYAAIRNVLQKTPEEEWRDVKNLLLDKLYKYTSDENIISFFMTSVKAMEKEIEDVELRKRLSACLFDILYRKDEYEVSRLWLEYFNKNKIKKGYVYLSLIGKHKTRIPVPLAKILFRILSFLSFLRYSPYDIHMIRKENRIDYKYRMKMKKEFTKLLMTNFSDKNKIKDFIDTVERVRGYGHVRENNIQKHVMKKYEL